MDIRAGTGGICDDIVGFCAAHHYHDQLYSFI